VVSLVVSLEKTRGSDEASAHPVTQLMVVVPVEAQEAMLVEMGQVVVVQQVHDNPKSKTNNRSKT